MVSIEKSVAEVRVIVVAPAAMAPFSVVSPVSRLGTSLP